MRRAFADGVGAVVTGAAASENLAMINRRSRCKYCRGVAVFADICRLYVRRILADRVRAIVAAHTVVGDTRVVENHL